VHASLDANYVANLLCRHSMRHYLSVDLDLSLCLQDEAVDRVDQFLNQIIMLIKTNKVKSQAH
jgi:hypothetical protein